MEVLNTKNLKKIYGNGENQVKALDGINLSIKQGEFVSIVGTSGSGKSTLLHMRYNYPSRSATWLEYLIAYSL